MNCWNIQDEAKGKRVRYLVFTNVQIYPSHIQTSKLFAFSVPDNKWKFQTNLQTDVLVCKKQPIKMYPCYVKHNKFAILKFLYYNGASKYSSVYFEHKKEHDQIQLFLWTFMKLIIFK